MRYRTFLILLLDLNKTSEYGCALSVLAPSAGLTARINVLFDIEERANLYYINGDGDNSNSNPDPNPNSEGGGGDDPVPSEG